MKVLYFFVLSCEANSNAHLGFSATFRQSLLVLVKLEFTSLLHFSMYNIMFWKIASYPKMYAKCYMCDRDVEDIILHIHVSRVMSNVLFKNEIYCLILL